MQPKMQNDLFDYLYKRQNGQAKGPSGHSQDSEHHEKRKKFRLQRKGPPRIDWILMGGLCSSTLSDQTTLTIIGKKPMILVWITLQSVSPMHILTTSVR